MGALLLRFQQLSNGLSSLNVAVPALKMIHVKDVQKVRELFRPPSYLDGYNTRMLKKCDYESTLPFH
jgi:hypothetical protein